MDRLIQRSKEEGRDLTLSSTKTAILFYEKLGFKRISDEHLEDPVPMIYKVS
jgi:predicted GNAT family N-acyltransferase